MRLTTIWSMPSMSLRERLTRTYDWAMQVWARHLPQRVRFWAYIQVGTAAMGPNDIVPEARFTDLLERVPGGPK